MSNFNKSMSDFIGKIGSREMASANRYWVEFDLPDGVSANSSTSSSVISPFSNTTTLRAAQKMYQRDGEISMMCHTASMPSRSLVTIENRHRQMVQKLPYSAQYDDVTFIFHATSDMRERIYFERWQETIYNVQDGSLNFYNEFVQNMKIHQLNKQGDAVYSVELVEAYPINIGSVEMGYANTNQLQNVSVTMAYKYWHNIT